MNLICTFLRSTSASLAVDILRHRGLKARVRTIEPESHFRLPPVYVVETRETDVEKFLEVLVAESRHEPEVFQHVVRCPECDSIRAEFPAHPKRSPSMRSVGYLVDRVGELLHMGPPSFGCRDCHETWKHHSGSRRHSTAPTREAVGANS